MKRLIQLNRIYIELAQPLHVACVEYTVCVLVYIWDIQRLGTALDHPNLRPSWWRRHRGVFHDGCRHCNFRMQFSGCDLQTAAFRLQLSDCSFRIATFRLQLSGCNFRNATSDCSFQTATLGMQLSDCNFQAATFRMKLSDSNFRTTTLC